MKKKILFVLNQMGAGGIAKSLSNLLFHLEKYKEEYDVDLFLLRKDGCFMSDVPSYVNILESKGVLKLFGASQKDTEKFGKCQYLSRFLVASWTKAFGNQLPLKLGISQNKMSQLYDLAVSFAHTKNAHDMTAGSVEFVAEGINTKKKVYQINCNVKKENILTKSNIKNLNKFDKIYCVSKSCSEQINELVEELSSKTDFLYNTQRNDIILEKSNENIKVYNTKTTNLVMVSRLEEEKAHMRFLPIVKRLREEGCEFNLHIIGDGSLRGEIESYILENNMLDYVKMYGQQSNPFPYVREADLFILVSYYEAAPMVYNEAQLLHTPVFTTNIVSAEEMVGEKGFICNNTEQDIYDSLKEILTNKKLIKDKKTKLKNYTYDNDEIVRKLLSEVGE